MTIRSLTLVALVMVMGSISGCSGMKNFMFGRGARCGLCSRARAVGNAINPLASPPVQAPTSPGCRLPGCGLFNRNQSPAYTAPYAQPCTPPVSYAPAPQYAPQCAPQYAPQCAPRYDDCQGGYADRGYIDQGYSSAMAGNCECGSPCGGNCGSANGGGIVDPYLGSGTVNGGYQGEVLEPERWQPRSYESRRYDAQGDRIISEEPLPSGIEYLN